MHIILYMGLYRGHIGIMEKKMEATIMGLRVWGNANGGFPKLWVPFWGSL